MNTPLNPLTPDEQAKIDRRTQTTFENLAANKIYIPWETCYEGVLLGRLMQAVKQLEQEIKVNLKP